MVETRNKTRRKESKRKTRTKKSKRSTRRRTPKKATVDVLTEDLNEIQPEVPPEVYFEYDPVIELKSPKRSGSDILSPSKGDMPFYLYQDYETILDKFIKKRFNFSKYIAPFYSDKFICCIMNSINKIQDINSIKWIGGGLAWNFASGTFLKKVADEKRDIFTTLSLAPGNADIFMISNNLEECQKIICKLHYSIKICLDNLIAESENINSDSLNDILNKYDLKFKYNDNIKIDKNGNCEYANPKVTGSSLFGYEVSVILRKKQNVVLKYEDDFDGMVVLYFASVYSEGININKFRQMFLNKIDLSCYQNLNTYILNRYGLFFFNQMITINRSEKKINIDNYRKNLLVNYFNSLNIKQTDLFQYFAEEYPKLWDKDDKNFDKNIQINFELKYLEKKYPSLNENIEEYSEYVMNVFRPYINSFIKFANTKFQSFDSELFIVGGDAMRRYDYNISKTKDIDCKLYIKDKSNEENTFYELYRMLEIFTKFLICNKQTILANKTFKKDNLTGELLDPYSLQFRIRRFIPSSDVPIELFSLDYRSYIFIQDGDKTFKFKKDIPILDVVIEINKKSGNFQLSTNGVPYATKEWILNDFQNTYSNLKKTLGRVSSDKIVKDRARYNFFYTHNNSVNTDIQNLELDVIEPTLTKFMDKEYKKNENKDNYFNALIQLDTITPKYEAVKVKFPFSYESIENLAQKMNNKKLTSLIHKMIIELKRCFNPKLPPPEEEQTKLPSPKRKPVTIVEKLPSPPKQSLIKEIELPIPKQPKVKIEPVPKLPSPKTPKRKTETPAELLPSPRKIKQESMIKQIELPIPKQPKVKVEPVPSAPKLPSPKTTPKRKTETPAELVPSPRKIKQESMIKQIELPIPRSPLPAPVPGPAPVPPAPVPVPAKLPSPKSPKRQPEPSPPKIPSSTKRKVEERGEQVQVPTQKSSRRKRNPTSPSIVNLENLFFNLKI
jgi:hypothetical protein